MSSFPVTALMISQSTLKEGHFNTKVSTTWSFRSSSHVLHFTSHRIDQSGGYVIFVDVNLKKNLYIFSI